MKIKAFLESGRFVFIKVFCCEELKELAAKYKRWEYLS
ncbi:hypothetical protein AFAEC_1771 [Aliarcobacter faecis]|nr:hypothetical protein AFAEC_1771 [Aliarcobacter faecis]